MPKKKSPTKKASSKRSFPNMSHHPDKVQIEHDLLFVFLVFLILGIVGIIIFSISGFVKNDAGVNNNSLDESSVDKRNNVLEETGNEPIDTSNLFENNNYLILMEDYEYDHPLKSEACKQVRSGWTTLIYLIEKESGERSFLYDWCGDSLTTYKPVFAEDEDNIYFGYSHGGGDIIIWDIILYNKINNNVSIYQKHRTAPDLRKDIEDISGGEVFSEININPNFVVGEEPNSIGIEFEVVVVFTGNKVPSGEKLKFYYSLGEETIVIKDVYDKEFADLQGRTYESMFERIK